MAVGLPASMESDVWAFGCSFVRLRSEEGLFSAYDTTSLADLLRSIIQAIDGVPAAWEDVLFDSDGQPTKDTAKCEPIWKFTDKRPFKERIYKIWGKPSNATNKPAKSQTVNREENIDRVLDWDRHDPYPHCFSHKFWKPTSIKVGDEYINGYSDDSDKLLVIAKDFRGRSSLIVQPVV